MLIAIDGPAGAGKTTVARAVAAGLGLSYLDTGSMYRAFALKALESSADLDDGDELAVLLDATVLGAEGGHILLDGRDVSGLIRTGRVAEASSRVAAHPQVRRRMVEQQRAAALRSPRGAVIEGRDIATVVFPEAELKVFITAQEEERARRRSLESGLSVSEELEAIRSRDRRDTGRQASPLTAAPGAIVVDTTGVPAEEVAAKIVRMVKTAAR